MLSVFPAPAGINRISGKKQIQKIGVPRASGDKPFCCWFEEALARVFPAPAGINRKKIDWKTFRFSVPRASGDKP